MDDAVTLWVVDQGNTRLKLGVFIGGALKHVWHDEAALEWMTAASAPPQHVLVAASGVLDEEVEKALEAHPTRWLKDRSDCGLHLDYETPDTLGWDRIANAAAVTEAHPDSVAVIVDAGTCITVDLVADGTFYGGSIAPGIDLRFRAMYAGTANLPLVEDWRDRLSTPTSTLPEHIGTDTIGSLLAGAWGGAQAEIQGRIADFRQRWPDLKVFWTGGDAEYLHGRDSGLIFADSNLTLKGYHAILSRLI